ncbi:hypothetical protein L596_006034 [Steinernema carpocapsae]|uniref:Homeobox domain-containing protein n=1 Tax=Steinernema carpocapsae TaxID=34508 RepID=A0A4U8V284_STECR|nr:hypothetical protein L596_006034 [Steinernema carpocapsae]
MSSLTSTPESKNDAVNASQLQAVIEAIKKNPLLQALIQASLSATVEPPKRAMFSEKQKTLLESLFEKTTYPNHQQMGEVARKANLSYKQVKRWVQNQRYRMKRQRNVLSPSSSI